MIPGPIIIKKCSSCSLPIKEHTITSGNTYGARFWTDGKMDAPMMPDHPWLVRCPYCKALLWIDEQEKLGEVSPFITPSREAMVETEAEIAEIKALTCTKNLRFSKEEIVRKLNHLLRREGFSIARAWETPSLQDYFSMLEKGISDHKKEQYVRLRAWWAGNDKRRRTEEKNPLSDREKANLRRLADLLDEASDRDRIMKAEVLRELGLFDDALSLLAQPFDDELSRTVSIIKDLVAEKDPFVAEITSR